MPIWIYNVALAVFGFGATLAAFGGATWIPGSRPTYKGVTGRGWLSLLLATLALIVGIKKEFASARSAERAEVERASERIELIAKLDDSKAKITELAALVPPPAAGAIYIPEGISASGTVKLQTGSDLTVVGGERLTYTIPGAYSGGVKLSIGQHEYPLDRQSSDLLVIGDGHTAMPIRVLHPPKVTVTPARFTSKGIPGFMVIPVMVSKEVRTLSPTFTALQLSVRPGS
jgi:hypothetical protein